MAGVDCDTVACMSQGHTPFAMFNRTAKPVVRSMSARWPIERIRKRQRFLSRRTTYPLGYARLAGSRSRARRAYGVTSAKASSSCWTIVAAAAHRVETRPSRVRRSSTSSSPRVRAACPDGGSPRLAMSRLARGPVALGAHPHGSRQHDRTGGVGVGAPRRRNRQWPRVRSGPQPAPHLLPTDPDSAAGAGQDNDSAGHARALHRPRRCGADSIPRRPRCACAGGRWMPCSLCHPVSLTGRPSKDSIRSAAASSSLCERSESARAAARS